MSPEPSESLPEPDRSLLALARAIAERAGGREALERMARLETTEVPLSSFLLPMHAGSLLFFLPERFPDRAAARDFIRSEAFSAWIAVVQQVVIGGVGVPAASGPIPEIVLERARVAAHALLGDLERLAQVAADPEGGSDPIHGRGEWAGARGAHRAAGRAGADRRSADERGGSPGTLAADLRRTRGGHRRRRGLVSRPQIGAPRGAGGSFRDGEPLDGWVIHLTCATA